MNMMVSANPPVGVTISPLEGSGSSVMATDIFRDFPGEVSLGGENAACDNIALNFREPDFNLVEPRGIGGRVMKLDIGMGLKEFSDRLGFVRRKVIGNDMDFFVSRLRGHNIGQKGYKLCAGMAFGRFAEDFPAGDMEGRVERKSPVAEVLKPVSLNAAWREGQHRIEPVKRLNGSLLIDTEDCRVSGRFEIESDDIGSLGLEIRIITDHVMPATRGLQSSLRPNSGYSHVAGTQCRCQLTRTPVRGAIRRFAMQSPIDNPRFQMLGTGSRGLATVSSPKSGDTIFAKARSPELNRVDAASRFATHRHKRLASSQSQNDPGAANIVGATVSASANKTQLTALWRTQSEGCWHRQEHTPEQSDINVTLHYMLVIQIYHLQSPACPQFEIRQSMPVVASI